MSTEAVTCEIHAGAVCFIGGEFDSWTCPACELEELVKNIDQALTRFHRIEQRIRELTIQNDAKSARAHPQP